jgi:hypothetical protein
MPRIARRRIPRQHPGPHQRRHARLRRWLAARRSRARRSPAYAFNDRITYNVITPYYYPYYAATTAMCGRTRPPPTYLVYPAVLPVCWSGGPVFGPRLWVC